MIGCLVPSKSYCKGKKKKEKETHLYNQWTHLEIIPFILPNISISLTFSKL